MNVNLLCKICIYLYIMYKCVYFVAPVVCNNSSIISVINTIVFYQSINETSFTFGEISNSVYCILVNRH